MTEAIDEGVEAELPFSTQERLRKAISQRVQRVLSTDEGVKAIVSSMMPKELISATLDQMDGARNEAVALLGREVRTFLEHLDVGEELAKILTAVSFEVRLEVRFVPNEDGSLKPTVRSVGRPRGTTHRGRKRRAKTEPDTEQEGASADENEADSASPTVPQDDAAPETTPPADSAEPSPPDVPLEEVDHAPGGRRRLLSRSKITSIVQNVADVATTTARVAAEVAADAAAEVVNEARRARRDDDEDEDEDD